MQPSGYRRVWGNYLVSGEQLLVPIEQMEQKRGEGPKTSTDAVAKTKIPPLPGIKLALSSCPCSSLVATTTVGLYGAFHGL